MIWYIGKIAAETLHGYEFRPVPKVPGVTRAMENGNAAAVSALKVRAQHTHVRRQPCTGGGEDNIGIIGGIGRA